MKKLYLLTALLASFAFGMQKEKIEIIKPILSYIKNDSGLDYVFSIANPEGDAVFSREIPAHTTQTINKELSLAYGTMLNKIKMGLSFYQLKTKDKKSHALLIQSNKDNKLQIVQLGGRGGVVSVGPTVQTGSVFGIEIKKSEYPQEIIEIKLIPAEQHKELQKKELQTIASQLAALLIKDPANEASVQAKIKGLDLETLIAINELLTNQTAINRVQTLLQQEIQEKVSE